MVGEVDVEWQERAGDWTVEGMGRMRRVKEGTRRDGKWVY